MMQHETELIEFDTIGLPEYRVTEWMMEADGDDIRVACGARRFGHVEWLYTVVMTPEKLLSCLLECARYAGTAQVLQMLAREGH